jgi:hypothetical protein
MSLATRCHPAGRPPVTFQKQRETDAGAIVNGQADAISAKARRRAVLQSGKCCGKWQYPQVAKNSRETVFLWGVTRTCNVGTVPVLVCFPKPEIFSRER